MSQTMELPAARGADVRAIRPPHIAPRVVFVDGLPGCGKTLFSAIVGALDRMELEKYNYQLEYVCALRRLGRMTEDASTAMIRMLTDLDLYNVMIAREINFRPGDLSSALKTRTPWRYLRRLWAPDGEGVLARIREERPILNLVTHSLLPSCDIIAAALEDRFRYIEIVRHPLYMLKAWHLYIDRYGVDARDFTIWIEHAGRAVPWFARGWEAQYLDASAMDRVIYAIAHLLEWGDEALARLSRDRQEQVQTIPFERFVLDPWPYLYAMERLLDTSTTEATQRELKKQRVPRARVAAGLDLEVYRANGWVPPSGRTEADELAARRAFAAGQASDAAMRVLDRLSRDYEMRYLDAPAARAEA